MFLLFIALKVANKLMPFYHAYWKKEEMAYQIFVLMNAWTKLSRIYPTIPKPTAVQTQHQTDSESENPGQLHGLQGMV